jgi:hypothetical protein
LNSKSRQTPELRSLMARPQTARMPWILTAVPTAHSVVHTLALRQCDTSDACPVAAVAGGCSEKFLGKTAPNLLRHTKNPKDFVAGGVYHFRCRK